MIDVHSHILPGVDDGARSWEEAISMCRMAWEDGVHMMAATPHVFNGVYEYDPAEFENHIEHLNEHLSREKIPLEVVLGAEVFCRLDLPAVLDEHPALTLNRGKRYFLLEFPHHAVPPNSDQLIFRLLLKALIPVIVHPERNLYFQEHIDLLERFVRSGALCQVTAMSLTGKFGSRIAQFARSLLERDCVHVVASDAHGIRGRPPILSEARTLIQEQFGEERARSLFETMPEMMIQKSH
jgi:protein-tyrosine phosphatase